MSWTVFDRTVRAGGRGPGPGAGSLQVRVITEGIRGEGSVHFPILVIPLGVRLSRVVEEPQRYVCMLLEIGWELQLAGGGGTIAFYRSGPLFFKSGDEKGQYDEHYDARIALSPHQMSRIESYRRGKGLGLELTNPWGLLEIERKDGRNLVCVGIGLGKGISVSIPQSEWVEKVLQPWGYGNYVLLELDLTPGPSVKILSKAHEHLSEAQMHLNNGNDEDVLAAIHKAFENVAKKLKLKDPDRATFQKLLKGRVDDDVRDKVAGLLSSYCHFLHLGRHVPGERRIPVARREAEFALCTAKSALVYLSKVLGKPELARQA